VARFWNTLYLNRGGNLWYRPSLIHWRAYTCTSTPSAWDNCSRHMNIHCNGHVTASVRKRLPCVPKPIQAPIHRAYCNGQTVIEQHNMHTVCLQLLVFVPSFTVLSHTGHRQRSILLFEARRNPHSLFNMFLNVFSVGSVLVVLVLQATGKLACVLLCFYWFWKERANSNE